MKEFFSPYSGGDLPRMLSTRKQNYFLHFIIFFIILIFNVAIADDFDWEDAKKNGNISEGLIGKIDGIPIYFKRGSSYFSGHSEMALSLNWRINGQKDCCEEIIFQEIVDGADKKPFIKKNMIIWRVYYEESRKPVFNCWKLQAGKDKFRKLSSCQLKNTKLH